MIGRLRREIAFARHIPPLQIARRAGLALRGTVERRTRPNLDGDAILSETAPLPLFPPRPSGIERSDQGWSFTFLGRSAECGPAVDWQLPGDSERDRLWTMNLHYFEHAEALQDAEWTELVRQWIDANPPYGAESEWAAWNPYALSIRTVSWLQQLVMRQSRLDSDFIQLATRSAAAQLRYLERHLETDIGGNHLFKNILALLWGSAAIECAEAGRWRSLGLELLNRELGQFLADGMHFELSPSYHSLVLADCLSIRHALRGDMLAGKLDRAILKALQAAVDLIHPDGLTALFGDSGLHMARPPAELLTAAATMTGPLPSPRPQFAYPDAGYFGLRDGGNMLVIDAGPLGPDRLPGHAHGDMFSFEWSVGGERLIVDQGVVEYAPGERRQASRSAWNHNTVAAPGADQGEFFGAFRLGKRSWLRSRDFEIAEDHLMIEAEHDGFVGRSGRARHRRRIDARPTRIRVEDKLSRPMKGAAAGLLIAPTAEPRRNDDGSITILGLPVPVELHAGGEIAIEPAVWWPDMGVEIATHRLRIPLTGAEGWFELTAKGAS